jgi:hypothetical protein
MNESFEIEEPMMFSYDREQKMMIYLIRICNKSISFEGTDIDTIFVRDKKCYQHITFLNRIEDVLLCSLVYLQD